MAALIGAWPWTRLCYCVVLLLNISLSRKIKETGVVSVVGKHVVSYHCEGTVWYCKFYATSLIKCITNVTKHSFLISGSDQSYAHTNVWLNLNLNIIIKGLKHKSSTKVRGNI